MSNDIRLFISNDFDISDIIKIIELNYGCEVKFDPPSAPALNYSRLFFTLGQDERRILHVHTNARQGGFTGTLLTLGEWGTAYAVMNSIAKVTGGYRQYESDETITCFERQSDGSLTYLLQQAMIEGKCDGRNVEQLLEYIKEWDKKKSQK